MPDVPGEMGSVTSCQRVPPLVLMNTPESAPPATTMSGSVGSIATIVGCG